MKLIFFEPCLTEYRLQDFSNMIDLGCHIDIVTQSVQDDTSFGSDLFRKFNSKKIKIIDGKYFNFFGFSISPFSFKISFYERYDRIIFSSDIKNLSILVLSFLNKVFNRKLNIVLYGHGLYRESKFKILKNVYYHIVLRWCSAYICYSKIVADSMVNITNGIDGFKLRILNNSIYNEKSCSPLSKKIKADQYDFCFIGRLKNESNIINLIEIFKDINHISEINYNLHVIGGGELYDKAKSMEDKNIQIYGPIYENAKINPIVNGCIAGIFPSHCGLSVVHYLSFSLIVITHDDYKNHGPEFSYLRNGFNSILYDYKNFNSLTDLILNVSNLKNDVLNNFFNNSYDTYKQLSYQSNGFRFLQCLA
jgi:hypothetical protein